MIKEVFDAWKEECLKATGAKVKEFDVHKDRIVTLPDGTSEVIAARPAYRNHEAYDLDSLVRLSKENADKLGSAWFSRAGVTTIFDEDTERKHKATMRLTLSAQIRELARLEQNRPPMKQSDIISLLRITFKDCGLDSLVAMLRQVKFTVNQEGQADIQRGKVSVGNSHLAEFHGLANLPESMQFPVPIFESRFVWVEAVNVAVEPDPTTQTFKLIPYPGQLEQAIAKGEAKLGEKLREMMPENVAVYFGVP